MKIDGHCHCGYVTFEAEADANATAICHCTDCQMLSGSAFRTVVLTRKVESEPFASALSLYQEFSFGAAQPNTG